MRTDLTHSGALMLEHELSKRGHPRNRFLIQAPGGDQQLIDATGLNWEMLGACRTAMDRGILDSIDKAGLRPQDILLRYAQAWSDPEHMYLVWHSVPPDLRTAPAVREDTLFNCFYHALRHWRRASVRHLLHNPVPRVRSRQVGAGLVFHAGEPGYLVSETAAVTATPRTWQVVPGYDVDDFERRWHDTLDALTARALRAGGLTSDEIAADWPDPAGARGMSPPQQSA